MKQAWALCSFGLAVLAFAQIDGSQFATELRAKYGPPLARETFTGKPGVEMIVDYAANGRLQDPASCGCTVAGSTRQDHSGNRRVCFGAGAP
jgi:hypothetical protein